MKVLKIDKSMTIALVVAIAFFMQNLDTTAVNTAIPSMALSFKTSVLRLNLGITSYLIALSVFIPISGWIADKFGTRNVFCSAIVIFVISSALCGLATTLPQFVIFRVMQGIGGAMMTPVGRLAVLRTASKENLVEAMAYITWPALVAPIIGPMLGGYFATYYTWHWIFFINIPIGIICIFFSMKYIPNEKPDSDIKTRFDFVGFALSGIGLSTFMLAIEMLSNQKIPIYYTLGLAVFGSFLVFINVRYSRHISNPLINYSVLTIPTYRVTIYSGTIARMVIGVAPYLVPLMFQTGFGYTPFKSGLLFLATMAGNLIMKPITVWVMRKYCFKYVLIINGFLIVIFTVLTAFLGPNSPIPVIVAVMFFSGMFRSMQFSAITTLAFADVPQASITTANTLYSTVQQVSAGLGIAMGGVLLHLSNVIHGDSGIFTVADFRLAFFFVAILGIVSLFGFTRLSLTAGDAVRGLKKH